MSDLKPVSRPSFLLDGRGGLALTLVGLFVVIALLKPWGSLGEGGAPAEASVPTPSPSPSSTPTPPRSPDPRDADSRRYDPLIFGDHEPPATWGLWPAGYMVSFGFVMNTEPSSPPSGGPSPAPSSGTGSAGPIWPAAIDVPLGNHLLLIGVNMPEAYGVDAAYLTRLLAGGRTADVPIVRLPSPWSSHFTVIGLDGGYGAARTAFWPPGRYRLDLVIEPGTMERSIEIRVEGAPTPSPPTSLEAP